MGRRLIIALVLFAALPRLAWAEAVGTVVRLQGDATADGVRGSRPLAHGAAIDAAETIATGQDARLELRLADGTQVTIGERARVVIDDFIFRQGDGRAALRVTTGAFRVVTGAIGKLANHPFTVLTPHGSIGIRGTDFWGGPLEGAFDLLLLEGAVYLDTPAGRQILSEPGGGVTVARSGQAPSPPGPWSQEKIAAAVRSISFR